MNEYQRAVEEMRRAADRYFRVRDNGGDLRPVYPALAEAFREWARWHPKEVYIVDAYRRIVLGSDGEPVVFRAHVAAEKGTYNRRTTGQCLPRQKEREKGVAK